MKMGEVEQKFLKQKIVNFSGRKSTSHMKHDLFVLYLYQLHQSTLV